MAETAWVLYGATGFTGQLIARHAVAAGLRPVLAAREPRALAELGRELGLEARCAKIDDPDSLARMLAGRAAVVNAAGPFALTQPAVAEASLRAGVDYFDLSGDAPLLESLGGLGADFAAANRALVPAIGFDVVFSDAAIADAASRIGPVRSVRLGLSFFRPTMSQGSWKSALEEPSIALVRRDGRLCERPASHRRELFDFGSGPRSGEIVTWGDLVTAAWTTGAPDVTVLVQADWSARIAGITLGLLKSPPGLWLGRRMISCFPAGPDARQRSRNHSSIVAEVTDQAGNVARTALRTADPYDMTARAVVAAMQELPALDGRHGLMSPTMAFGAAQLLAIDGCKVVQRN